MVVIYRISLTFTLYTFFFHTSMNLSLQNTLTCTKAFHMVRFEVIFTS